MRIKFILVAVLAASASLIAQDRPIRIHAATIIDGTGKVLHNVTGPEKNPWGDITFTPDGKVLVTGHQQFTLIDPASGRVVQHLQHGEHLLPKIAGFDRGGTTLIAYQEKFSGDAIVLNMSTGKKVKTFKTIQECPVVSDGERLPPRLRDALGAHRWDRMLDIP